MSSANNNESKIDSKDADILKKNMEQKASSSLVNWLRYKNAKIRYVVLCLIIFLGLLLTIIVGYFSLYKWLPDLWNWGFSPVTWRSVFSILGAVYLVMFPAFPFIFLGTTINSIIGLSTEAAAVEFKEKMSSLSKLQVSYEAKLETNDQIGLIPLIRYSRLELEQYYIIGLSQTKKSYSYSILSMWIGFIIIMLGIVFYIIPFNFVNPGLVGGNFQILTIASGIFIELISALFLFIYKNSMQNLTYLYNRQIFIHNTLFAYKITESMTDSDSSKRLIIEKILDYGFKV